MSFGKYFSKMSVLFEVIVSVFCRFLFFYFQKNTQSKYFFYFFQKLFYCVFYVLIYHLVNLKSCTFIKLLTIIFACYFLNPINKIKGKNNNDPCPSLCLEFKMFASKIMSVDFTIVVVFYKF